jgi:hypothetical protein
MKTEERLLDLGKMIQDIVAHEVNVIIDTDSEWFEDLIRRMVVEPVNVAIDTEWFEDLVRRMVEQVVLRSRFENVKQGQERVSRA